MSAHAKIGPRCELSGRLWTGGPVWHGRHRGRLHKRCRLGVKGHHVVVGSVPWSASLVSARAATPRSRQVRLVRARLGTAIEPGRMAGMCTVGTVSTGRLYLEAWSTTATRGASGNPAMSPNGTTGAPQPRVQRALRAYVLPGSRLQRRARDRQIGRRLRRCRFSPRSRWSVSPALSRCSSRRRPVCRPCPQRPSPRVGPLATRT
jgi:hypothetical protein